MKTTLRLEGLDCAACAEELAEEVSAIDGIESCSVVFMMQKMELTYRSAEALAKAKDVANHFEEVRVIGEEGDFSAKTDGAGTDRTVIRIQNLHCAACAMELQEEIERIGDVGGASVDFVTQTVTVGTKDEDMLRKIIRTINRFEKVKVVEEERIVPKKESHTGEIVRIAISAVFFAAAFVLERFFVGNVACKVLMYLFYAVAYFSVGTSVLRSTAKNIVKGKIFDENFLMTIASICAVVMGVLTIEGVLQGDGGLFEGVAVMLLYQIGELLQGIAVGSSRRSITQLVELRSESATLFTNGEQRVVSPETLQVGDLILVKAGEKIPVDCEVAEGEALLDTKSLTGESVLREAKLGDEVLAGCVNAGSNVLLRVKRLYTDSAVAKILDLVENSAAKKAAPEKFITKFAKYYTPAVCGAALLLAVGVPLVYGGVTGRIGEIGLWQDWILRALSVLVISCPCALIISVPLTYFSGIGTAAKHGILVKGATYLDEAAKVSVAAFDKTGTLTQGDFSIVRTVGEEKVLLLAAAAEKCSSHPLSKPFLEIETPYRAERVSETAGRGIRCEIEGQEALVGSETFLRENNVDLQHIESVCTVVCVALCGEFLGYVEIDDRLKADAVAMIEGVKELGIKKCAIVTGDNPTRANKVMEELGGGLEVYAGLLPDEKLNRVEELKKEGKVLYVGDGINDAPVMSVADCSFSMGKLGSGAAIEASDFVLVSDRLSAIPLSLKIAKKTKKIVMQNIVFSIAIKVVLMILGGFGVVPVWLAVFGDVGVMLLAVLNSFRMRLKI